MQYLHRAFWVHFEHFASFVETGRVATEALDIWGVFQLQVNQPLASKTQLNPVDMDRFRDLRSVVRLWLGWVENTIHRIKIYPMDSANGFPNTYPAFLMTRHIHDQAPVVQTLDSAIHWINHYPVTYTVFCLYNYVYR